MNTIKLNIQEWEKDSTKEMKPMIFGHFVEFMRDCIDEGMWAQVLKNRGFDKKKDIPQGVVDGNPNVAEGWYRIGYKNAFEITLDDCDSLARDGYAQKINCYNDYNGFVGIAQENLCLDSKEYQGYVWMKSLGKACVSLILKDLDGHVYFQKDIQTVDGWKKYEFNFTPNVKTVNGIFEIKLVGEGTLWLDGASIMPADHVGGIWKEVFEHIKGLNAPVIRYPGGCFADCYHFEDGIGPIDSRPYRHNKHWGGFTDNSFGMDEYMEFCKNVGCEPMICINFGSGTAEEAANWVEYCNGSIDTVYGRKRSDNGHPEPYNIKYWDIGNEIFGEWEIGHSNAEEYAKKYLQFYTEMKKKDDSIVFMVCGGDGDEKSQEWNQKVADIAGANMDSLCLHMYALKLMDGKKHSNEEIYYAVTGAVKKYEEILNESYKTVNQNSDKEILISVTEYNLGTIIDSYREQTLEGAIFNAGMLNMFMRNCDKLLMCNYSDLVNGWPGGCIVSKNGKAFGTASYYVLKMYSECNISQIAAVELNTPYYNTDKKIGNIEPLSNVPMIDAVAGMNELGEKYIFAVNRSFSEEAVLNINDIDDGNKSNIDIEITELYSPNTSDMNTWDEHIVLPEVRHEKMCNGVVKLKPHSINRIKF